MLRVIQTKSAGGAKSYYSKSDYLSEGQELTGIWGGKAAERLGLSGEVEKFHFDALCDNQHPQTGDRLTARNKSDRTVGYDFNFHVPKGVSLAYLVNDDKRILQAFRDSVEETMREIEGDASTRVRKNDQQEERQTGNLVWATFVHNTARPVAGEPDPHLHAHAFVFNTTFDDIENRWKAGQFRELKRDASYYEAAFHARLAARIKELGYGIERQGHGWDIAGLPPEMTKKFSRRTAEIEALATELGIENVEALDGLGAKTRSKKESSLTMSELKQRWRSRLSDNDSNILQSLLFPSPAKDEPSKNAENESMKFSIKHCFERDSVVPERLLLATALRFGVGNVSVEGMHQQLEQHQVIRRKMHQRNWATTPEVLAEETAMLRQSRASVGIAEPLNEHWTIQRTWLNEDQQRAVQHVLQAKDNILMVRGGAGTGKTSLMQEAAAGIEAGGRQVFVFAPSAQASRGVLVDEGFKATTVAELLLSKEKQAEVSGNVIWIDEAGLLGTRTLKSVIDLAERAGAKLILSGDWRQHRAVERGAAMRLLEQEGGISPAIVRKVQRQTGAYKDAVLELAQGRTMNGFNALDKLGWIHEIEDSEQRYQQMAVRFAESWEANETVLAVAPTHAEANILTEKIRAELIARGQITGEKREFIGLDSMRLTEAERTDDLRLKEGDVMVLHRAVKGAKRGARLDVTPENIDLLKQFPAKFDVFRKRKLAFATGDLIRITANGKTKDKQHSLNNGQVFRIKGFSEKGDIVLGNGWVVDREYGFLAPGYVSTSHSAQGKTVENVLIAESSMSYPAADTRQFYVSVSRGRNKAEIFTDDKLDLRDAVMRDDERVSATELVRDWDRPRTLRHFSKIHAHEEAVRLPARERDREHERN